MGAPRLESSARRDKSTERTQFRLPFQLKAHVETYARRKGFTTGQALRELISIGLNVEDYKRDEWFVEPLNGD